MTTGKQRDILEGARTVFARDGYSRASLDTIAATAGVSTRTIYNHFTDKARLFQAVIIDSSERVAEVHIGIIDRHLGKIVDLEQDLIDFGLEWEMALDEDLAVHFAMVRQISAEAEHIPADAYRAWQEAGPLRVRRHLADRLRLIADKGLLRRADDFELAALHLLRLISADSLPGPTPNIETRTHIVTSGVQVFLHGYAGSEPFDAS
jgi:AcrR family transcriptional regulator